MTALPESINKVMASCVNTEVLNRDVVQLCMQIQQRDPQLDVVPTSLRRLSMSSYSRQLHFARFPDMPQCIPEMRIGALIM